jgi:hypothetical protein
LADGLSVAVEDIKQCGRIEDAFGPGVELVQSGGLGARRGLFGEKAALVDNAFVELQVAQLWRALSSRSR